MICSHGGPVRGWCFDKRDICIIVKNSVLARGDSYTTIDELRFPSNRRQHTISHTFPLSDDVGIRDIVLSDDRGTTQNRFEIL